MHRSRYWGTLALIAAAGLGAGCRREGVRADGPQQVVRVDSQQAEGAFVPAESELVIRMNEAIGTVVSLPGQRFTATLESPLRSREGRVIVPRGATVGGVVTKVDTSLSPSLQVRFDRIETQAGAIPLEARIRDAARHALVDWEPELGHDVLRPSPQDVAAGYGRDSYPFYTPEVQAIRVPEGALLRLALTQPLFPSGARQMPATERAQPGEDEDEGPQGGMDEDEGARGGMDEDEGPQEGR